MKLWKHLRLLDWLRVDTAHKTPRHIQEAIIEDAKRKRERRAEKWRLISVFDGGSGQFIHTYGDGFRDDTPKIQQALDLGWPFK